MCITRREQRDQLCTILRLLWSEADLQIVEPCSVAAVAASADGVSVATRYHRRHRQRMERPGPAAAHGRQGKHGAITHVTFFTDRDATLQATV